MAELEESRQRLEGLMSSGEVIEERRKTEILEEKNKQGKAEAEIMENEAKKAEARVKIAEAEARMRKATEPQPQQPQPKTRIDMIDELEKEIRKLKEAIAKHLQRNEKAIEEEGKLRGLPDKEIERLKDLERARLAKIEMEEIEKLERKYR